MKQQVLQTSYPRANETIATKHFHKLNKSGRFVTVLFEDPRYPLDDVALTIFRSAEQPRVDYVLDNVSECVGITDCIRYAVAVSAFASAIATFARHTANSRNAFLIMHQLDTADVTAMEEVATVSHNRLNGHTSPFATLHRSQGEGWVIPGKIPTSIPPKAIIS
jgi:hypothetical protein